VDVKSGVFGFFKVRYFKVSSVHAQSLFGSVVSRNNKILDIVDLETEPWQNETTGMWIDVPKSTLQLMKSKSINPAGAIHSAEHALLNRFALASDLRTECKAPEKEYKKSESPRKRPAR
jgi:DEAD/DEAH box helicase domain-containing protein